MIINITKGRDVETIDWKGESSVFDGRSSFYINIREGYAEYAVQLVSSILHDTLISQLLLIASIT